MIFDTLINRCAWFGFLLFTAGLLWPSPGVSRLRVKDVSFARSDSAIRRNTFLWMSLPWLVMGLGQLIGSISFWRYYSPRYGGPWVMFFYVSVCTFWAVSAYWIFIKKGATSIVEHGLLRGLVSDPGLVKLLTGIALVGGIAALLLMYSGIWGRVLYVS